MNKAHFRSGRQNSSCGLGVSNSRRRQRATSFRRSFFFEGLERRDLLAGLFYWSSGERIELCEDSLQIAVQVSDAHPKGYLNDLTSNDGLLADYQLSEQLSDDVWRLELSSPVGPYLSALIDISNFSDQGIERVTPSFKTVEGGNQLIVLDEVVIGLIDPSTAEEYFESLKVDLGEIEYRALVGTHDQFVVTLPGRFGRVAIETANQLTSDSRVAFASPNTYQHVKKYFTPNDTLFATQWHLNNTGSQVASAIAGADIKAVNAWDTSTGGGVTIAVIDDGMERTHPDLAANIFVNPGEIANNNIDDDGNGYIDDVSGWSFSANSRNPTVGSSDDHSTSVAGVAAAVGNNGIGVTGAAFNARILPIQIASGNTFTSDANIASAIYYAAGRTANGLGTWNAAQIINCSWGGGSSTTTLTNAFAWASNTARAGRGVATFISSGNDYSSSVSYPASLSSTLPGVMAVGATNHRDTRSEYSNYGSALDFVAPSNDIDTPNTVGITTTDRSGTLGYNTNEYTNNTPANGFGGTSSASPLAAGIGALLVSANPNITAAQVKATLRSTADKVGGVVYNSNGFNSQYGYGRLNAFRALQMNAISTTPSQNSVVNTPPDLLTGYRADFSFPFDPTPAYVDLSKVTVNGISPTSFSAVDSDTIQFVFSTNPVTSEGNYTFNIGEGAVRRQSDALQNVAYSSSFVHDTLVLARTSVTPASGLLVTLPGPFTVDMDFNEPIDPSTIGTNDLTVTRGSVTSAVALDADTIRYTIDGISTEGSFTATLLAGSLTDLGGMRNRSSFAATYHADLVTVVWPAPFVAKQPVGSLVYDSSTTGVISLATDSDSFTLSLDPRQKFSVLVSTTSTLFRPRVEIFDPSNASLGSSIAVNGKALLAPTIQTNGGDYRIEIRTDSAFIGDYTVYVALNAIIEEEGGTFGGPSTGLQNAQSLDAGFATSLIGQIPVSRTSVLGKLDLPVDGGYTAFSVTPTFTDISSTGTRTILQDTFFGEAETLSSTQLNGFTFPFYGTTYDSLAFSNQGLITFGGTNTSSGNGDLRSTPQLPTIATLWDSFVFDQTGVGSASRTIYWKVVGTGLEQQLIVQWNNANPFTSSNYLTFQAILSTDGSIQFNYANNVLASAVASATVGVKASGSNARRLLVHYNQPASTLVGPGLSTRIVPVPTQVDFYRVNLSLGDRVGAALANISTGNINVDLVAPDLTTVLATGVAGSTNLNEAFAGYLVPSNGSYLLRVSGDLDVSYNLVVTKNAAFDSEANNTLTTAQPLGNVQAVLGSLATSADAEDWYSFQAENAGDVFTITTSTPNDGPRLLPNNLDPHIELYSPNGNLIATGVPLADSRNEVIQSFVAADPGIFRVRVASDASTQGDYGLSVERITASPIEIINRRVFYNNTNNFGTGGSNNAPSVNPINAIDMTKEALLPGQTSSMLNYTNYSRGLNGIVIDVRGMSAENAALLNAGSFEFASWDSFLSATPNFVPIAPTVVVSTFIGGGQNGSTRIKLTFVDREIENEWLRVTMRANGITRLPADDVFYFGNARFDVTPTAAESVTVNAFDVNRVRAAISTSNTGLVSNIFDVDRSGAINAFDVNAIRSVLANTSTLLRMFSAPPTQPPSLLSDESEAEASLAPNLVDSYFSESELDSSNLVPSDE